MEQFKTLKEYFNKVSSEWDRSYLKAAEESSVDEYRLIKDYSYSLKARVGNKKDWIELETIIKHYYSSIDVFKVNILNSSVGESLKNIIVDSVDGQIEYDEIGPYSLTIAIEDDCPDKLFWLIYEKLLK